MESGIERAVDRLFSRGARVHVQPLELGAKLAQEMEARKVPSLSRTYVPNRYTVYLCEDDRRQVQAYEGPLAQELETHLVKHAQGRGYILPGPPRVRFETDGDLRLGRFGIGAEMSPTEKESPVGRPSAPAPLAVAPPSPALRAAAAPAPGSVTPGSLTEDPGVPQGPDDLPTPGDEWARDQEPGGEPEEGRPEDSPRIPGLAVPVPAAPTESISSSLAAGFGLSRQTMTLRMGDRIQEFEKSRVVIGRARDVDFHLDDPNVSRRHAALAWKDGRIEVRDLDSTNGTLLNGRPVKEGPVAAGDIVTVGGNEIEVRTG